MDRRDWMAIKAYLPAAFALAVAVVSMAAVSGWQNNPYLAGFFTAARWPPVAALAFATGHAAWTTYRLWQAERGEGLLCACGGPLGHERNGQYGRPFRRCLACARNVARRHYE